ncbi:Competence protein ComEA [Thiobacillus denitrificans ATCC 25259]|uniref:Competence protein ComEA n=1 Tax=Thiobacillus denitrificans (strain ATCC 25259 / T1) TaxID=292415 RepID=Q3SI14_THIDA|nr:helix-hairpin-helix domain-containing protein [Thiobacillus denitrificans]AAZ97719.1 Competence protein ComEA [Thiobacillus denitrificans ATCC 25259]
MKLARNLLVLAGLLAFPAFAAVNINTATQSELEAIRGVGPAKAKAIISYRDANGAFKSVQELDKVKGFGKASVEKLQGELTVGAPGTKQ